MVRGIDKTNIFRDDEDKARFLERLGQTVTEGECTVYAWVLMDNHIHLLFKSSKAGISTVMRNFSPGMLCIIIAAIAAPAISSRTATNPFSVMKTIISWR